jgi:hypothetical protein
MIIFNIIFYIAIGLLYLGISFPYQELLIGICALIIGVVMLVEFLRR